MPAPKRSKKKPQAKPPAAPSAQPPSSPLAGSPGGPHTAPSTTPPTRLVIATSNPHKVQEVRDILASQGVTGVTLLGLGDLPGAPFTEPNENGDTFEANATIKAVEYAKATGETCLADDSGLEIDALGGRPGVTSSHYYSDGREEGLGRGVRDALNNARVMRELQGIDDAMRTARFVCVMAVASPDKGLLGTFRGTFEGRIGQAGRVPRGDHGFGYDPLFLVAPEYRVTSAELEPAEKNSLSHRGHAAASLALWLKSGSVAVMTA
jgi:non-canonical purine NTP pyrophosphatase (RdgB/HAM1 family)